MKWAIAAAVALSLTGTLGAHRLDEYLQATILSIENDHVEGSLRLVPGVAVASLVLDSIDANRDGILSESECRAYAARVLRDMSLSIDGERLSPRLISVEASTIRQMRDGSGEIRIDFRADLPPGGMRRTLALENGHQKGISVYLMNSLVPRDRTIQIVAQRRNENQSAYEVEYTQSGDARASSRTIGFASIFRLGMRHIAEGADHLLFLLTLLLPAPLIAFGCRWSVAGSAQQSLVRILRVVTAFTIGHSITLALAGLGLVRVPSRPIEVLIAVSILVSAVHAIRPLFPGREDRIAASFGLIHGLAFASTISELGFGRWERVMTILAFNLGIETMQLVVVAATLPSLLLLSRTRQYDFLRIGGGVFAGVAATGWILERVAGATSFVDVIVNRMRESAVWIAGILFLAGLGSFVMKKFERPGEEGSAGPLMRPPEGQTAL
jgi:HupE / UreJ protein